MRKPAQVQCSAVQYSTVSTISTVQFAQAVRADALSPTVTQGGRATTGWRGVGRVKWQNMCGTCITGLSAGLGVVFCMMTLGRHQ